MIARPVGCCDRVRGLRRGAENREEVNYFFLAVFFAPALAFVDFLAAFLVAISRDSCHLGFRCHFLGKSVCVSPASDERDDRSLESYSQVIDNPCTFNIEELRDKSTRAYIEICQKRQAQLIVIEEFVDSCDAVNQGTR